MCSFRLHNGVEDSASPEGSTSEEIFQRTIDYLSLVNHESDLDRQLMLLAYLGREITRSDRCTVWMYEPDEKISELKILAAESKKKT